MTLTEAVVPVLEQRHGPGVAAKVNVISTCVDLNRFALAAPPAAVPVRFLLAGTINRFYDVPAMVALVEATRRLRPVELVVASPEATPWDSLFASTEAIRTSVRPEAMPATVAAAHVGLSVCRESAGISLRGSMPTKIAEFLAVGRPVVVNPSLGDAAALLREHRCGVVLDVASPDGAARAADELQTLLSDAETAARCRRLAEEHFDLERAVDRLAAIYRSIAT